MQVIQRKLCWNGSTHQLNLDLVPWIDPVLGLPSRYPPHNKTQSFHVNVRSFGPKLLRLPDLKLRLFRLLPGDKCGRKLEVFFCFEATAATLHTKNALLKPHLIKNNWLVKRKPIGDCPQSNHCNPIQNKYCKPLRAVWWLHWWHHWFVVGWLVI